MFKHFIKHKSLISEEYKMQKKNSLFNVGHEVSFWTFKRTILWPFLEKKISKNRVLEV